MHTTAIASAVIAASWLLAAGIVLARSAERRPTRLAGICLALAIVHAAAAAWNPLAPLTIAAWLAWALAAPRGALGNPSRRIVTWVAVLAALGWTIALAASDRPASTGVFIAAALVVAVGAVLATALRYRHASAEDRRVLQWLASAAILLVGFAIVVISLHAITGSPQIPRVWFTYGLVLFPLGQLLSASTSGSRTAAVALTEAIAVSGLATLVSVVYLVVVVGIHGPPEHSERGVLLASLAAAVVVAILALPVRRRLVQAADSFIGSRDPSTDEVATTFAARMSRAVPMDELLLQLAESLRATGAGVTAEIWTGSDGILTRAVSVPSLPPARLQLAERERLVVGQTRIGGPGWATIWMPTMVEQAAGDVRIVPVAHLGELLGIVVVRRPPELSAFSEEDETPLVELARQLGLALHNVRLDSALQASLAELAERNEELQASRLRIVSAADDSRRAIERNLHDGAQQHLVALAVKLGLAAAIAEDGDTEMVRTLVADLREDVQTTITELRELAHGIYPPLLRARGLPEALRTAANRSPLSCSVEVDAPNRYPEQIEATIYFCCLEAMQNAGKYAGDGAQLTVRVNALADVLCVEVADDGIGFDAEIAAHGQGFVNMRDRLGAIGADLLVESTPSVGTKVSARIPIPAAVGSSEAG